MAERPQLEMTAAVGLITLAVIELHKMYRETGGSIGELRCADPSSTWYRQALLDADYVVGGTALLIGGALAFYTRSWHPLAIMALGFGAASLYHHSVLSSESFSRG